MKTRAARFTREWVQPILVMLLIIGSLRSAVADWNDVPTGSMKPTILEGERIFVNKLAYDLKVPFTTWRLATWADPARGDVVVLFSPADGKRLVKRVIGIPGDRIALANNRLFVNGAPVAYEQIDPGFVVQLGEGEAARHILASETLGVRSHPVMFTPHDPSIRSFGPIGVPPGQYFVMGDNRDRSLDSRWFGFVAREKIVGKATAVVASVDPARHFRPRWQRFFHWLR
ncbi:MAG: signal peptidase I [Acidobacteriota bacterium]